ncbi:IQ domain-containing protein H-like isoform X1 [Hydractinia symbiolongicarpus]|uniref:IQ domain-containing protein H-like isoform X1 n=1 Tax=Hydractinia symbiolongicarpus TaxID=13093 RepID=UPI00254FB406|nr:IQ domain-containing protein H-like isoform X1 [Hydractinia symbiolongicarpus]
MAELKLDHIAAALQDVETKKKTSEHVDNKNLNDVLTNIQQDITQMKQNVLNILKNDSSVDYVRIKSLFEQMEYDVQKKRQNVISQFNSKPATLTASSVFWQDKVSTRNDPSDEKPLLALPQPGGDVKSKTSNVSPGQKFLALQKLKSIINPTRPDARSILNKYYGVPLPFEDQGSNMVSKERQQITGLTLTRANMKHIANSVEEKAASQLSNTPLPVQQKKVVLHQPVDAKQYKGRNLSKPQYNLALVRFDEASLTDATDLHCKQHQHNLDAVDGFYNKEMQSPEKSSPLRSSSTQLMDQHKINKAIAPMSTPASDLAHRPPHRFVIQNGRVNTSSQDFLQFKKYYCLSWESVSNLLLKLKKVVLDYSIPIAFIDGDRLADLAMFFELGPKPTIKDLLMCVLNSKDVECIILIPGRRYIAPDGVEAASIKIQSTWRCHRKHTAYLEYRRRKWAAGIIALTWMMKCKMTMIRSVLKQNQIVYLQNFRKRAQEFQNSWKKIKTSKRVIVHIPSLGYNTVIRDSLHNISTLQNNQIGRICDVIDPDTEVIYVCPIQISEELQDYYLKLLHVVSNATGQDYNALKERLKIITPNHFDKFPQHNLSLSTLLKYSTKTILRIKGLIKGKQAYIVPGMMNADDLFVSEQLGIPILGTEPDLVQLYSMKSGVRRIFESAGVTCAPGEYDVYSMQQIYETLARLVTENLNVTRWLFKMDNQVDGRGTAYCDVTPYLSCLEYALKEEERYGEKWNKKWAYESVYNTILLEIPEILMNYATPDNKIVYPTWGEFLTHFLAQGGIIEACPPSDSTTSITANVLIEPDGEIKILSVADQIHSTSRYNCWGHTIPQSSIKADVINSRVNSISCACKNRGIVGYCSIDFVTFIDPQTDSQVLWAVGLGLSYNSSYSLIRWMTVLTNGHLNVMKNTFEVDVDGITSMRTAYNSRRKKVDREKSKVAEKSPRYCVLSTNLHHTNLNNLHYSVFFQLCKAHGIGYDEKLKVGTTFTLMDHIRKDTIGMLTIGESLHNAVSSFAMNLSLIHQDISSPNMQGVSNFKGAVEDLKCVLKCLEINMNLHQRNVSTVKSMRSERQVKSASDSAPSTDKEEISRSNETFFKKTPISSSSAHCFSSHDCVDHRFPSSPVSGGDENVI